MVCWINKLSAQTFEDYKRQAKREFEAYREKTQRDFSAYRDSVNAEFARYMRETWKKRDGKPAIPLPERSEPPKPVLKAAVGGKAKRVAAGMLLNFVQTAFEYRADGEQFGYERPFFPDETLFYPYSDCEDRAILYAVLVRELLGLDVVLLHYPNHLATAVALGDDVPGDYLTLVNTLCATRHISMRALARLCLSISRLRRK